ncbi:AAA family ATPase [Heliorestis acidaminivorans]|uniref:AAA family ATPase n=1 Tax=Heliorestis acidaminivorans TaxID=553427 RepID=UPI0014791350|nr:AAA family ATPase [Heliorestis acidaminivorans]
MFKIIKIRIEGLFDQSSHEFNLHLEGITILHAPNGFGKTTMLKLIDHIFNGRLFELKRIPFRKVDVFFSDQSRLEIIKERRSRNIVDETQVERISYEYHKVDGESQIFQPKLRLTKRYSITVLEELLPFLERVGPELWEHTETGEILDYHDVIKLYGTFLPLAPEYDWPDWLKTIRKKISVHFIGAHRLLQTSPLQSKNKRQNREKYQSAVRHFSNELVLSIQSKLAQWSAYSHEMDRTFPERLLSARKEQEKLSLSSKEQIEKKLKELEFKRARLARVGLIDQITEDQNFSIDNLDEFTCRLLSLYIEDTERKLKYFDDLEERLNLLLELVNKKFLNKELVIQRDQGFVIYVNNRKKKLEVDELSSGEQHILVMYYQLLFQTEPGEIVLLDEPELSLHIGWQGQFVEDLYDIMTLRKMTILIATHSPDIIDGRWNLTVALENP